MLLSQEDQETVHGVNERLSFENAAHLVEFMQALIRTADEQDFTALEDEEEEYLADELETYEEEVDLEVEKPLPLRISRKAKLEEESLPDLEPLPEDDEPLVAKTITRHDPED